MKRIQKHMISIALGGPKGTLPFSPFSFCMNFELSSNQKSPRILSGGLRLLFFDQISNLEKKKCIVGKRSENNPKGFPMVRNDPKMIQNDSNGGNLYIYPIILISFSAVFSCFSAVFRSFSDRFRDLFGLFWIVFRSFCMVLIPFCSFFRRHRRHEVVFVDRRRCCRPFSLGYV